MKLLACALLSASALMSWPIAAADGLVSVRSTHSVAATMERLATIVTDKGMKVFARIDHAAGAHSIGSTLRPTQLLVFGNPQGGTPFMQCAQTVAIDLPLKALVWEDARGEVWLSYNDPGWIAARHAAVDCPVTGKIVSALEALSAAATGTGP